MHEPSKNSRCPCGSGKKYRKCCRQNASLTTLVSRKLPVVTPLPASLLAAIQEYSGKERQRREFAEAYGHIRPPMAVKVFNGKMMVAIGGDLYLQTRDGPYNFLHAIHDHALQFFGESMLEAEEKKLFEHRHPALQWMQTYVDHHNSAVANGEANQRVAPIGAGAAWYRFAYDLYTIQDNATLTAAIKKRLINPDHFQAARHELWVAALCVAAGFDLQFEDESDNSKKHPEFVGVDRFSATKIAVEAKSRHRRGVNGFTGGKDVAPGEMIDIRRLVTDAYLKQTDLPLYIFVDVNLPPADGDTWDRWMHELDKTMWELEQEGYGDPAYENALFFSNDPSHYLLDKPIGTDADQLWLKPYKPLNPRVPHPVPDIFDRFLKAHTQRSAPPKDFPLQ